MNATSLWKKHRHRVGLGYFLAGVAVGVIISFLMGLPWRYSLPGGIASTTNLSHNAAAASSCTPSSLQGNGWNPVHVFYGDTNQIQYHSSISNDYFHHVSWYSQARQDEVVAALLRHKRGGYFVDLAANDPVKISNTYALETRLGWTGLCLEPNPTYWTGLAHRSNCHVIGAVVGARRMEQVKFRFPNKKAPKGGIVGEDFDNKVELTANDAEDVRPRYTVALSEILERFQAPALIDYLSLDVGKLRLIVLRYVSLREFAFCDALPSPLLAAQIHFIISFQSKRAQKTLSWKDFPLTSIASLLSPLNVPPMLFPKF